MTVEIDCEKRANGDVSMGGHGVVTPARRRVVPWCRAELTQRKKLIDISREGIAFRFSTLR